MSYPGMHQKPPEVLQAETEAATLKLRFGKDGITAASGGASSSTSRRKATPTKKDGGKDRHTGAKAVAKARQVPFGEALERNSLAPAAKAAAAVKVPPPVKELDDNATSLFDRLWARRHGEKGAAPKAPVELSKAPPPPASSIHQPRRPARAASEVIDLISSDDEPPAAISAKPALLPQRVLEPVAEPLVMGDSSPASSNNGDEDEDETLQVGRGKSRVPRAKAASSTSNLLPVAERGIFAAVPRLQIGESDWLFTEQKHMTIFGTELSDLERALAISRGGGESDVAAIIEASKLDYERRLDRDLEQAIEASKHNNFFPNEASSSSSSDFDAAIRASLAVQGTDFAAFQQNIKKNVTMS